MLRLVAAGGAVAPRRLLLERYRNAMGAIAAGPRAWRECGMDATQAGRLARLDRESLARACTWLSSCDHHLVGWLDGDYPPLLRSIQAPPLALFVAGDPSMLWRPAVAIVGSRDPTPGGRDNAYAFARALASTGLVVASGLAAGIDAAAHLGALSAPDGTTVAVLGTGVDTPYPASHAGLLARVAAHGAAVSEHLPGTPARKAHFPSRNRILAGLSLGIVVVEAAARSGALITARQATDAGREVFALPGSIHNPMARGCHKLLREGAALVESPGEVAELLAPIVATQADLLRGRLSPMSTAQERPRDAGGVSPLPTGDHDRLWHALGHDPTDMDRLVERTGLTPGELSSILLVMELEGRVVVEHGRYSRRH